jgi:hypothetical protein
MCEFLFVSAQTPTANAAAKAGVHAVEESTP